MDDPADKLNDPERLQALQNVALLDTPPEERFDRLTRLVGRVLDVPVSLVSLVDDKRQFFKSAAGLNLQETPLSHSFCQHVVADDAPLVISDARQDERLKDNLAIRDLNVVAYLGVPLTSPSGQTLGSLCAVADSPRQWTVDEVELMREFAAIVESEIAVGQRRLERRRVDEALDSSESSLRLALAAGGMGAWDWDLQSDVVTFSDSNYPLWRLSPGQRITAKDVFGRIHPEDLERVEQEVERVLTGGADFDSEFRVQLPEAGERWLAGRATLIKNAEGEPVRLLGVNYDITDDKRNEKRLEDLVHDRTAELETLNRELEAFNYSVSHDLRAPLRGIDGFSQALLDEYGAQLGETATHYLNRVRAGAQRMGELIDDLLDLSRLSRGDLRLSRFNLSELAAQVFETIREHQPEREIKFELEPDLYVEADKGLITVVLENLLGNAWKFTRYRENPVISLKRAEDGNYVVADNGAGFDMDYAAKLFVPFQRLHDTSKFEGSGIGLVTVQRIINRHGGRLWAEGEPDKGSSFFFTLPAGSV